MTKDWVGNGNSVFKSLGASNHTEGERAHRDYYATEPIAIDALFNNYTIPTGKIWECACGEGHLSKRMQELGYNVLASDIENRMGDEQEVMDFFDAKEMPRRCRHIITNPPYKYALEFVLHTLELLPEGGIGAFLLKTTFLEGQKRFEELFSVYPPKFIFQFVRRIRCAKNGDFDDAPAAVSYAWFIWEKGWRGEATIRWISKFTSEY